MIGNFFSLDFLKKHTWLEAILSPGVYVSTILRAQGNLYQFCFALWALEQRPFLQQDAQVLNIYFCPSSLSSGIEKMERHTKQAAVKKMTRMVDNALVFHGRAGSNTLSETFKMTAHGSALLNFQMREEKTERAGGIFWGWKRVFNGSIFDDEGIWLHGRLVSSTVTQVFICIFIIVFWAIMIIEILKEYGTETDLEQTDPEQTDDLTSQPVVYVWE